VHTIGQVELHPYFQQQELMEACEKAGGASSIYTNVAPASQ
jgi:diketogulonate reductase-like aldo/keto reductase